MQIKALALFSGGLDSMLSAKVVLGQGVELEGIHFVNAFLSGYKQEQSFTSVQHRLARQLGIKLHILDISPAHLEMVRSPRYGYGEYINPCIDCRILMFKQAKSYMQNNGFSFLISGEVLGQRPMSQRRDTMSVIDRDAGIQGLVLRPLTAKRLRPTVAEERGWVDRDKLFGFSGRSRKPQLALAEELGVSEYLTPAGGCLLTQADFSRKFKDLFSAGKFGLEDVQLLKVGRHFRYQDTAKIVVGRDEEDNRRLADLAQPADTLLKIRDFTGPLTVIRQQAEPATNGLIETAAKLGARYSKGKDEPRLWVDYWVQGSVEKQSIEVSPASEELIDELRI